MGQGPNWTSQRKWQIHFFPKMISVILAGSYHTDVCSSARFLLGLVLFSYVMQIQDRCCGHIVDHDDESVTVSIPNAKAIKITLILHQQTVTAGKLCQFCLQVQVQVSHCTCTVFLFMNVMNLWISGYFIFQNLCSAWISPLGFNTLAALGALHHLWLRWWCNLCVLNTVAACRRLQKQNHLHVKRIWMCCSESAICVW